MVPGNLRMVSWSNVSNLLRRTQSARSEDCNAHGPACTHDTRRRMKRSLLSAVFLVIFVQGCLVWERNWDLGACKESSTGSYGCIVKVPKCAAGVNLQAQIELFSGAHAGSITVLSFDLHNIE